MKHSIKLKLRTMYRLPKLAHIPLQWVKSLKFDRKRKLQCEMLIAITSEFGCLGEFLFLSISIFISISIPISVIPASTTCMKRDTPLTHN